MQVSLTEEPKEAEVVGDWVSTGWENDPGIERHITSWCQRRWENTICCHWFPSTGVKVQMILLTCTMKEETEERNPGHGADTTELCWDTHVWISLIFHHFSEIWQGPSYKYANLSWSRKFLLSCLCHLISECHFLLKSAKEISVAPAAGPIESWRVTMR